jgi:prepilin-type N-terminal cleavage/methylation domain-containing protein
MKRQVPRTGCWGTSKSRGVSASPHASRLTHHAAPAFTLIELMVVVAIMGIILSAGIPSLYRLMQKEGMRKVSSDVMEVCGRARAQAILRGTPVDIVFHPLQRRLDIGAAPTAQPVEGEGQAEFGVAEKPAVIPGQGQSAVIPDDFGIEMLDINLSEYRESEWARVRFFPNGTSDEMTLVLRSPKNEWKKITLEVTTGLASLDDVLR